LKSAGNPFDATDKIRYLSELEIPFFVGVVERSSLTLSIHSGEYLPLLFSEKGLPKRLRLKPVNRKVAPSSYQERFGPRKFRLLLPRVARISAKASEADVKRVVRVLHALCRRIHGNIATRRSEEHVYSVSGRHPTYILAGPGSVRVFRDNFYKRLAEAFFNFKWLRLNRPRDYDPVEVQIYSEFFLRLEEHGVDMPSVTRNMHSGLMSHLVSESGAGRGGARRS
jgi:hypothetical protein